MGPRPGPTAVNEAGEQSLAALGVRFKGSSEVACRRATMTRYSLVGRMLVVASLAIQATTVTAISSDDPVSSSDSDKGGPARGAAGIHGRVTRTDGGPIIEASVLVRSLGTAGRPIPEVAMVTDAEGRFARTLPPGRYEVTVVAPDGRRQSREVSVGRTAQTQIDFSLR